MVDQSPKTAGASKRMRIVLVVSLALNLAIAGLFVGSVVSGRWSAGPPAHFDIGMGPIGRALAPDERRDIRRSLMRDGSMRALNLRGRMGDMIAAIETDPFDPQVMRGLMAEQIARTSALQGNVQDLLLQIIADMTPQRRAEFAQQLKNEMSRERPPRDKPSGG